MKKTGKIVFLLLLISTTASPPKAAFAQDRSRLSVYVPLPTGGTPEQQKYFQDNFRMELIGANYPPVDTREDSRYTLLLSIEDNYDFDLTSPIADENKAYLLEITLLLNEDNSEVVHFDFAFNSTEEMNQWNLFIIYQTLANAYAPEDTPPAVPDIPAAVSAISADPAAGRWRDQWLYLNFALGLDSVHFRQQGTSRIQAGNLMPAVLAGLEFQLFNFFSLEADPVKLRLLDDGRKLVLSLSSALLLKGNLKFSAIMLEPYAGAELTFYQNNWGIFFLSGIGGFQMGFRAGTASAWTLDAGFSWNLTGAFEAASGGSYNLMRVHLMAGIKWGFFDRPKNAPNDKRPAYNKNSNDDNAQSER